VLALTLSIGWDQMISIGWDQMIGDVMGHAHT
jgi:hypothetical protein